MARIKRSGTKGVRRAAQAQGRAAGARRARAKTASLLDRAMGLLPFDDDQWDRVFMALILAAFAGVVFVIANLAGVPAVAQAEVARIASANGFEVRAVRVSGTARMDESVVYARALAQRDRPMPLVDIEGLRADLLKLPWVKDARVSLQLPDTLAIDIIEREPHAVLEKPDHLMLIDATGHELTPVTADAAEGMLRISGPGAARQMPALDDLLAAAPALALDKRIVAAEWIGNRRWNLTFSTGQVLALPEGRDLAAGQLVKFANLDGQNRLIGGKVASFDMRNPPRIYMRVPGSGDRLELEGSGE